MRKWNLQQAIELYGGGKNYRQICKIINEQGFDLVPNTIASAIKELPNKVELKLKRKQNLIDPPNESEQEIVYDKKYKKPILVFSDVHIPFNHKHYLKFIKDIDHKFNCDEQKICTGDLVDNHAISRHKKSGDADGAKREYLNAKEEIKKFVEAFPKVKFTIGNHDAIPSRQASEIGLYYGFLKSFAEAWELPPTWEISTKFVYKDVLYKHGINCGGVNGARATAIKEAKSTVIGHIHSHGGIHYAANNTKMIFGANAGCGIDTKAYAFEYGKEFKDKPTIGCVVVFSPSFAIFVPMAIDYYNKKYGR